MPENDPEFKEKVRNSFIKAKEDISELKNEIRELKELILRQEEQIKLSKANKLDEMAESLKRSIFQENLEKLSSGNEGVVINKQTNKHATHLQQTDDINDLKERFRSLTKQKLLLYLTMFNMEDEKIPITYSSLAKSLNLSEECVRVYVYRMLQKGIPFDRPKINNKLIVFKIPQIVRAYNFKPFLEDLYYGTDGSQRRLTDL